MIGEEVRKLDSFCVNKTRDSFRWHLCFRRQKISFCNDNKDKLLLKYCIFYNCIYMKVQVTVIQISDDCECWKTAVYHISKSIWWAIKHPFKRFAGAMTNNSCQPWGTGRWCACGCGRRNESRCNWNVLLRGKRMKFAVIKTIICPAPTMIAGKMVPTTHMFDGSDFYSILNHSPMNMLLSWVSGNIQYADCFVMRGLN